MVNKILSLGEQATNTAVQNTASATSDIASELKSIENFVGMVIRLIQQVNQFAKYKALFQGQGSIGGGSDEILDFDNEKKPQIPHMPQIQSIPRFNEMKEQNIPSQIPQVLNGIPSSFHSPQSDLIPVRREKEKTLKDKIREVDKMIDDEKLNQLLDRMVEEIENLPENQKNIRIGDIPELYKNVIYRIAIQSMVKNFIERNIGFIIK